jgi:16S rRNA (uracil1498-N3)-methyltransferase
VSRRRFLLRTPPERGRAALDPEIARHVVKVLRLAEGDAVVLFDGRGTEWDGVIERATKREVIVAAGEPRASALPKGPRVVLATALPKGRRAMALLAMVTEAGADAIVPVVFARSASRGSSPGAVARRARAVEEAARQCGRAWMPSLEPEIGFAEFAARPAAAGERRLLASPEPGAAAVAAALADPGPVAVVVLLVGPEGGLTDAEEAAARAAGFAPVSLGPHVLRVETAAVAAVVLARAGG